MTVKKKILLVSGIVVALLLVAIGLCYLIPGYLTPMSKYRKMTKLLKPYVTKEITHDSGFSETKDLWVLSMTVDEYEELREKLLAEGSELIKDEDLLYFVNYAEEKTEGDETEYVAYNGAEEVFLDMFDNSISVSVLVMFHEGKVHAEFTGYVNINHTPFAATK